MKFAALLFFVAFASAKRGGILMPDGNILHFESVKNERDNTEILTFGAKTMPGHLNGIKFHDFNTGYIASKLVDHGLCLISVIKYSKPTYINERLVKLPPAVNQTILPTPMSRTDLIRVAGANIATFCDDYTSYMMVESVGNHHSGTRALDTYDAYESQLNVMTESLDTGDKKPRLPRPRPFRIDFDR
ncbi:uncharacterized protein LOC132728809 [Ruditapes philippinarum]|uniref:uncharacterized protein LOC132728809 n=1 Tax=Ruditapes philippinarum TaxID=129788 RepID=UPI00295B8AB5|nr:uncharacterized protein LOC132728809 [Ruditapes philippinarum]